jgi:hypothetical protein
VEDRIEMSKETLRAELSALELRLVDRFNGALAGKAEASVVAQLAERVSELSERMRLSESTGLNVGGPLDTRVGAIEDSVANLQTLAGYRKWIFAQSIVLVGVGSAVVGLVLRALKI